jgi:hypothetical protein
MGLPALRLSAADFDALITAGEKFLAAAGRRLSMFVTGADVAAKDRAGAVRGGLVVLRRARAD